MADRFRAPDRALELCCVRERHADRTVVIVLASQEDRVAARLAILGGAIDVEIVDAALVERAQQVVPPQEPQRIVQDADPVPERAEMVMEEANPRDLGRRGALEVGKDIAAIGQLARLQHAFVVHRHDAVPDARKLVEVAVAHGVVSGATEQERDHRSGPRGGAI